MVLVVFTINTSELLTVADNVAKRKWKEAVEQLTSVGFDLDRRTYSRLLRRFGEAGNLTQAKQLHEHIAKFGHDRETFIGNLIVQMYGKCGNTELAQKVFNRLHDPNVISWNIVISVFARNGQMEDARDMLERMPVKSIVSWNTMISALSENGQLQKAFELFKNMKERDVVSWNAIINAFARNGQSMQALNIARWMDLEGIKPNAYTFVSCLQACIDLGMLSQGAAVHSKIVESGIEETPVCNALITMYSKCGSLEWAKTVFESMKCPDVISTTSMFAAYAQYGYLEQARQLFDNMPSDGNIVPCNAMLAAYGRSGHGKEALQIFQRMDLEGLRPTDATFASVLNACALSNFVSEGKVAARRAIEQGFHLKNVIVGNAVIDFYGKNGLLEKAVEVFDQMIRRDDATYNALIGTYARCGHTMQALEYFHLMVQNSVHPCEITFFNVLCACAQAGRVEDGHDYFVAMITDFHIVPGLSHYNCMVNILGRAGHLNVAKSLIESMPFKPNASTWRTFLGACRVHGSRENAMQAARLHYALDGKDSASYSLLSNVISDGH